MNSPVDRRIAVALCLSIASSIGLVITYLAGGGAQLQGLLLGITLGGIGWALVVAAHGLLGGEGEVEDRSELASPPELREKVASELAEPVSRRRVLAGLAAGALAGLAAVLVFPVRSLGRHPGGRLFETSWAEGVRLVTVEGSPIRVDSLPFGGAVTAFPEGHHPAPDSIVMLIRLQPDELALPPERQTWAVEGNVAYSKLCTHAGCPVGLFDDDTGVLICPCHQSTFSVSEGAVPFSGPAARPLPQLPLDVTEDGVLMATGEMSAPVGPGFWDLPEADG